MMNVLFKRSSSSALSSIRHRCISPLHSLFTLTLSSHHVSNPTPLAESMPSGAQSFLPDNSNYRRTPRSEFHSGLGNLRFRETPGLSSSQFAVAYNDSDSSDEGLDISKLGIDPDIVGALASRGIFKLFPIQRAVLEPAMQGRDMIGRAKTGTGKTLAFGIPILDKIYQFNAKHGRGRNPLAMVLAPTRELAKQVEKEFHESAPKLDTLCVYGGTPIQQQMSQLDYGVDVVVGTPGRVIDLLKRGALNLSEIQFIVLDEADQMLNVGFEEAVEVILEKSPKKRQTLMFSATMPNWIRNLSQKYLNDPLVVDLVGEDNQKLAEGISLYSIVSDTYEKASIVGPLVKEHGKGGKCIVFTGTKRDADRLAYAMSSSYGCEALHGDISQAQRERTLAGFRDGKFNILCATDVAARGLDIPNVDLVIHYDLANTSEIFVHRSGRTGRAGKKGNVILIHSAQQSGDVKLIEREVGCKFVQLPSIEGDGVTLGNMGGGRSIFGKLLSGRFSSGGGRYSSGGYGDRGSSRGGFGNSGLGRSSDYGGSSFGRTSGYGGGSGRSGSFGGSGLGESGGGFGNSNRDSGNFRGSFGGSGSGESGGGSGNSNRYSGNFGGSFGGSGSGESGGGSGNSNRYSGNFGGSGSGRTGSFRSSSSLSGGGFGNLSSGSFGDTGTSHFGNFGDNDKSTPKWSF